MWPRTKGKKKINDHILIGSFFHLFNNADEALLHQAASDA